MPRGMSSALRTLPSGATTTYWTWSIHWAGAYTMACISPVAGSTFGWAVNAPGRVPKKSLRPTVSRS